AKLRERFTRYPGCNASRPTIMSSGSPLRARPARREFRVAVDADRRQSIAASPTVQSQYAYRKFQPIDFWRPEPA
ncbi:hypothetical protein, partial [Escherichia coli]|uniref:hypothetical protein n=1 Tax=Escherichia coli TaxID=562 RepID=UPI001EDA2DCA